MIKVVDREPVIEGTADFDVKHQMTLKAGSTNWSEKFTISIAHTTSQGKSDGALRRVSVRLYHGRRHAASRQPAGSGRSPG
ncbi:hypothetical protein [Streptomyces sp. NPDC021562]|uniref:hypothetical protein n=1 Tax=Streptomyces sp. NPDC021562 TaxID=3155121 RepID=UPI00104ACEE1